MEFWTGLLNIVEEHGLMAIIVVVLLYLLHKEREQRETDNEKMRTTINGLKDTLQTTIDGLKDTMHENTVFMSTFKQFLEDSIKGQP